MQARREGHLLLQRAATLLADAEIYDQVRLWMEACLGFRQICCNVYRNKICSGLDNCNFYPTREGMTLCTKPSKPPVMVQHQMKQLRLCNACPT
jgi:hypothetical protein